MLTYVRWRIDSRFLNLAAKECEWSSPHFDRFTLMELTRVSIGQEAGWVSEVVWTLCK